MNTSHHRKNYLFKSFKWHSFTLFLCGIRQAVIVLDLLLFKIHNCQCPVITMRNVGFINGLAYKGSWYVAAALETNFPVSSYIRLRIKDLLLISSRSSSLSAVNRWTLRLQCAVVRIRTYQSPKVYNHSHMIDVIIPIVEGDMVAVGAPDITTSVDLLWPFCPFLCNPFQLLLIFVANIM